MKTTLVADGIGIASTIRPIAILKGYGRVGRIGLALVL